MMTKAAPSRGLQCVGRTNLGLRWFEKGGVGSIPKSDRKPHLASYHMKTC